MASEPEKPPPSTTVPSNTTPSSSAIDPPEPKQATQNATTLQRLRAHILRHLTTLALKTDTTLLRLSSLLSNPAATDALLCTFSYTLELVAALLSRLLENRLADFAASIAEKADAVELLPGETLIATLPAPPAAQLMAKVVASCKALAAVMGDFRVFVRLWGMLGIYTWARATLLTPVSSVAQETGSWKPRILRTVTWAQIASCALFQVLENGAYLASKGVLTSEGWSGEGGAGKEREMRWWMWSSRFWAVHVGLEIVRLWILYRRSRKQSALSSSTEKEKEVMADGEKEGKLLLEQKKREDSLWWRDLVSNVAYMPMTLHWSVEEERGILSDWGVGLLGAVAGGALLVDAWKATVVR